MKLGKSLLYVKRKAQVGVPMRLNIDDNKDGGLTRSSDEALVMRVKQRG